MKQTNEIEFKERMKAFSVFRDNLAKKTHADQILDYIALLLDRICPTKGREK